MKAHGRPCRLRGAGLKCSKGGIIKEAENALRVAQAAYRFGERGLIDVLDTQRVLRGILMDSLQARFDLQAAAAEIDRLRAHYPKEQTAE